MADARRSARGSFTSFMMTKQEFLLNVSLIDFPILYMYNVALHIPDELAQRLKAAGGDLSRRALEALALAEYKLGRLTTAELRRLLGFATRAALDGFLRRTV